MERIYSETDDGSLRFFNMGGRELGRMDAFRFIILGNGDYYFETFGYFEEDL